MSPELDITVVRAALEEEKGDLERRLAEIGVGSESRYYDSNFADTSQVTAERGEAEALANTLEERLEEVQAALTKMDEGAYGRCEGCQEEINAARLEAMPTARRCMSCASAR